MNEPDINDPDMNELDINEHEMNEPDIIEPDIYEPNINENNILEKCTKCRKFLPQNKFIKKKNTLKKKILKSCESCRQQSSSHYKALVEHYENEVLLPEEMVEKLFNEISLVGSDEYFENDSDGINFKSIIGLNDFKNQGDTPQEIAKKIANLIGDSDGYYYIYFNYYSSKKDNELHTFQYRCSQCRSLAKKPRKHQDPECQRDRGSIERFDCSGTLRISINMITNNVSIYLKHEILHKRPERNRVTEEIKNIIQANLHLMPRDIYRMLESNYPEITQKQ
ncbi:3237_t:CDS:1, partial [Cetraspora pellucida]